MSNLYAAHHIVSDDNSIANGVVEIEDGVVKRVFHLEKRLRLLSGLAEQSLLRKQLLACRLLKTIIY